MGDTASRVRCDEQSDTESNYTVECTCYHCHADEYDPQVLHIDADLDSSMISNASFPRLLGKVKPSKTITIFDWDDTLLCSSALRDQQVQFDQLQQLEMAVRSILEAAMSVGETLIVTNGTETWVQESSSHFLPGLVPTLRTIGVMSARAQYEHMYPGDPFMWKRACFRDLLADSRRGVLANSKEVNLVVCGDSLAEIQAAHGALDDLNCASLVKTVKFKEIPSVAELLGQLRRATMEYSKIVSAGQTLNKCFVQREAANSIIMSTCASSWDLMENETWDQPGLPAVF